MKSIKSKILHVANDNPIDDSGKHFYVVLLMNDKAFRFGSFDTAAERDAHREVSREHARANHARLKRPYYG